jgi:hypothetical protein
MLKLRKAPAGVRIEAGGRASRLRRWPLFLEKDMRRTYNEKSPETAHKCTAAVRAADRGNDLMRNYRC